MYNLAPPSPEVENFQMKIYYPAGVRTTDLLNQRETCYHLNMRGELTLPVENPDKYLGIPQVSYVIIFPTTAIVALHFIYR